MPQVASKIGSLAYRLLVLGDVHELDAALAPTGAK